MNLTPHALVNRAHWDETSDEYQALHGKQLAAHQLAWGAWSIPEDELRVLGDVTGKDVLEFGCGAAQWSIGLTERGARCVGLDVSERQLTHARANMAAAGTEFPLVLASAEDVPLADESFDVIFCDHGAMTFADPQLTIPQAARLLRPGGLLAFSAATPIHYICWDERADELGTTLRHNYFDERKTEEDSTVCFSLPYGEWIALFRRNGFIIDALIELRPPADAVTSYDGFVEKQWARSWPAEQIWRVIRES
jgi:SAM-dependent methyltransferase